MRRVRVCVHVCMYSDSKCRASYLCAMKPSRARMSLAPAAKGREGEALRYYWKSLAFPRARAREVCFADVCYDARGSRTYCAYQSASRVSYEPENAGESCDERFPPFWNRANAHGASFSPRSPRPRVTGRAGCRAWICHREWMVSLETRYWSLAG